MIAVDLKSGDAVISYTFDINSGLIFFGGKQPCKEFRTLTWHDLHERWTRSSVIAIPIDAVAKISNVPPSAIGDWISITDAAWLEGRDND